MVNPPVFDPDPPHNRFAEGLQPEMAALLLVDAQRGRLASALADALTNHLVGLARLADGFGVPVLVGGRLGAGAILAGLEGLYGPDAVMLRRSASVWQDGRTRRTLQRLGRRDLILAGLVDGPGLEDVARGALDAGFIPHVAVDATSAGLGADRRVVVARLNAAGIRTTSWVALLAELAGARQDLAQRVAASLSDHLDRYATQDRLALLD